MMIARSPPLSRPPPKMAKIRKTSRPRRAVTLVGKVSYKIPQPSSSLPILILVLGS
jgi:hypothetical protein